MTETAGLLREFIHKEAGCNRLKDPQTGLTDANQKATTWSRWSQHLTVLLESKVLESPAQAAADYNLKIFIPALIHSRYFAILKDPTKCRSIFSGGRVSSYFLRPPPVNLPDLHSLLKRIASIIGRKPFHLINFDFRHFFHQIKIGIIKRAFTLRSKELFDLIWAVLPMGWSYSPRIAQCFA